VFETKFSLIEAARARACVRCLARGGFSKPYLIFAASLSIVQVGRRRLADASWIWKRQRETLMSMFDLSGRVAVITGGNGDIGLGMAHFGAKQTSTGTQDWLTQWRVTRSRPGEHRRDAGKSVVGFTNSRSTGNLLAPA
jgi:hypothetical protein